MTETASASASQSAPAAPAPSPVVERTLANGLRVLLREDHDAPLASFWTWYRVGSRNETPGLTGASHWVEHMQFKGTPSLAKGQIFRDVSKHGGVLNALTSNDWTAYFETLPADRLDLAIAIESDRMANSLFDAAETELERTVILSERQGAENSPSYLLYEEVVGTAFRAHPYRHMVIGHETDLRALTRDNLYGHYRRHYRPNNAFITAVGDFDAADLLTKIEGAFGGIEPGPPSPPVRVGEPPQLGERRVTLRRPAPTSYLRMAFHAPAAAHPDTAALLVADAVLSGGKGMGLGGGGPMGRSSRLYRALVSAGLARGAGSDFDLFLDPYVLVVGVTALPGADPDRIERVVDAELARLRDEEVATDELARALKQVKAQYVYSAEGVTNRAFWLGQMEIVDTYQRADAFVGELEGVTPADVRRVAQTYLAPAGRTVGWLLPDGEGGGDGGELTGVGIGWTIGDVMTPSPPNPPLPNRWERGAYAGRAAPFRQFLTLSDGEEGTAVADRGWSATGAPVVAVQKPVFERAELPNGIVVLGQARPADPTVVVRLRIEAGAVHDPTGREGVAAFTARMLTRGAGTLDVEQLNEATDGLGASLSVEAGRHVAEVSIRCLREDLPALLDLAADVTRRPNFPEAEIEKVRNELLAAIREADNDTRSSADRALRRLLYPAPHPLGRRVGGEPDTVVAITRDDLIAFHAARYGPRVTTVAVVGGVGSIGEAVDLLAARFGDWAGSATPGAPIPAPPPPAGRVRDDVSIAGKSQADLAIGFPSIPRSDPAYYALDTANLILGRLGLMGRLGASVRDAQGLAYYAYSQIEPGRDGSLWSGGAGIDPANVERALESIVAELRRLRDDLVDDDELADAKSYLTGVLPLALESNDGVAATLLSIEMYGLGLDFLERYPGIIAALDREGLQAATRAHLDPERLAVAVAGPPGE